MANSDAAIICPACNAENKVGARFCRQCGAQIAASAPAYDRAKWQALVLYDSDISAAADTVRPFGQMWVDELGTSYMALNDKSYLPGIVEKVTARAKAERQRQAEIKQQQADIQAAAAERARQSELERQRIAEQRREQLRVLKATLWGSRNRQIVTTCISVALIVALGFFYYWLQPSRVDAHEIWSADDSSPSDALHCTDIICLEGQMEQHHASKRAVEFARELTKLSGNPSWAANFHKFQNVDLIGYDCAVPTCEYAGNFALVNGTPRIILIDPEIQALQNDPVVRSIPMIANGSSFLTRYFGFEREFQLQDGTQRFVFAVNVSTCEACQPSGAIEFAFDFDDGGKLVRQSTLGYVSPTPANLIFPPMH